MQKVRTLSAGQLVTFELSPIEEVVLGSLRWGDASAFGTPAYWKAQILMEGPAYRPAPLGETLRDELVACMLAGHGLRSEVGLAAFRMLRRSGLLSHPDPKAIAAALREPLPIGDRLISYRFPNRKAALISAALKQLPSIREDCTAIELRDRLMSLPGVGPKTASWIVRNRLGCDEVAILDVHIVRACRYLNVFKSSESRYHVLEKAFVQFAGALGVRTSILDAIMWHQLRLAGKWWLLAA